MDNGIVGVGIQDSGIKRIVILIDIRGYKQSSLQP